METIKLSQGLEIIVDDGMAALLTQVKWSIKPHGKTFYAKTGNYKFGKPTTQYLHHFIVGKPIDNLEVDHIDGNGLNNQRGNLRFVSRRQNMQNQHGVSKTSRYPGVYWNTSAKKWQAYCQINNKSIYLGVRVSEEEAFALRNEYLRTHL